MIQSPIQLVCFDVGGVLLRICRSWREGCAAAGLDLRGPHHRLHAANDWFVPSELIVLHQTGRVECHEYFQRVSQATDQLYSADEIASVHSAWLRGEFDGVGDLVDRIHQAGIETAALSNTNHAHWIRMREFPSVMKLQHRLASHELGLHKPDRAIFIEAERRFKRHGAEILFFDDLQDNIEAARSVGWNAVLIDPTMPTDVQIERALKDYGLLRRERRHSTAASSDSI